jgi:dephospho-CoA kinase
MTKNIFGLTGGIGSGKSTLARILQKKYSHIEIFDCDKVAKKIMETEEIKNELKKILGEEKAEIIFTNPVKKKLVESLIHSKVWQKLDEEIKKSSKEKIILVESAILFDIGKNKDIPKIIATVCNLDERKKRIKIRNNWSEKEIEERIKSQISDEVLIEKAMVVVNTDCSLKQLEEKSEKLYQILINWKNKKLTL